MTNRISVQSTRLAIDAIEDDVLCLTGGRYRAVLEVGTVNFGLSGEDQQEAIIASYGRFLNSLTYPVQILVRALPIDIERYLEELERRARSELAEPLAELARDHVAFLRRLARSRTLLERRFYLVLPPQDEGLGARAGGFFRFWHRRDRERWDSLAVARKRLTVRCDEVARELARCDLAVRRLGGIELAQLLHSCWCPELARIQRVRRELAEYTALVVTSDSDQRSPAAAPPVDSRPSSR